MREPGEFDAREARKLRVLQVVEPCDGGVFRHVDALTRFLLASEVEVGLAFSTRRDSEWRIALEQIVKLQGPTLDLNVGSAPSLADLKALFHLVKLCRKWRPHVIHGHSSKGGALARLLALIFPDARVLYTPNAYIGFSGEKHKTWIYDLVEGVLGRVGLTVNVSHDENRFALKRLRIPEGSTVVIPNAVDFSRYRPRFSDERANVRKRLGIPESATILTTIARYSLQKDPITFYKAILPVLQDNPAVWLVHIGKGEMKAEVAKMSRDAGVEDRILRIDFVKDTAEYLSVSDGFVLASRYEGFPISVVEALACNLPIVIADCKGNGDFAALGLSHCWYYGIGDAGGLSDAVRDLLEKISEAGSVNHREIARQRYSEEECFGRILSLYKD